MRTKKRFFLKAAGISPAKAAGISLAFVMAFAMAFAACDTGTSSGGSRSPDTGTDTDYAVPVNRTFKNGDVELKITEAGGVIYYKLVVSGTQKSYGTATAGATAWTFSSYAGQSFSIPVSGTGDDLAFGAATITADDGTEIPIPALTLAVGTEEKGPSGPPVIPLTSEQKLINAVKSGATGVFRITSSFALTEDLDVGTDQHIVVGGTHLSGENGPYSVGSVGDGPLFAATNVSGNSFSIGAKLTLKSGATLTIVNGGAVNIKTPATGKESVLYVSKGAKVGVGVDVTTDGELAIGAGGSASSLNVESEAILYFEKEATLAVTNDPLASKVKLEDTTSAMTLETGANLAITVTIDPDDEDAVETAKTAAATAIGGSGDVVIVIPSGAPAAIGTVDVTVTVAGDDEADVETIEGQIKTAVNDALEEATEASPAKTTADADELDDLVGVTTNTSITYTGEDGTLADTITLNANQTLILNGNLTVGSAGSITGDGSLVVASGATVVVEAEGTVDVSGSASSGLIDVTAKYTLPASNPGELAIESAKKDLAEGLVTITLSGETGAEIPYNEDENSVYYDMFDVQDLDDVLVAAEAAKGYSAVVIAGLLTYGDAGKIKQINQAFNMSKKDRFELINGTDKGHGTDNVYREKTYDTGIFYPEPIGGFDMLLWNGAAKKTIDLEISQPSDATPQKFVIDYNKVTFKALNTITVTGADVYTDYDDNTSLDTALVGTVKIGEIPIGSVTGGLLSFRLPALDKSYLGDLTTVADNLEELEEWEDYSITEGTGANAKIWNNLTLYDSNGDQIGTLSFGRNFTDGENNTALRGVKFMYFDRAVQITGEGDEINTTHIGSGGGWFFGNKDYSYGSQISTYTGMKWVYTAEPETEAGAGGGG